MVGVLTGMQQCNKMDKKKKKDMTFLVMSDRLHTA